MINLPPAQRVIELPPAMTNVARASATVPCRIKVRGTCIDPPLSAILLPSIVTAYTMAWAPSRPAASTQSG